jgi:UDP-glucuronate decarboxylase
LKILVTGGADFIDSHLSEKNVSDGETVYCLDNFENGDLRNVYSLMPKRNFKLVRGNIARALDRGLQEFVKWYRNCKFAEWEKLG